MTQPYFYLIMPFGSDPQAKLKQRIVCKVGQKHQLHAHFPVYDKSVPAFSLVLTIGDLKRSAFVLADLSLQRPSCYYELGLAEAIGKKTYVIAEQGTDIHQTANRNSVHFYEDLHHLQAVAEAILRKESNTIRC